MRGYNKVILMGNLTREPELKFTPKGTAVAKFGLAISRVWYNDAKEKREEVTFVDVDAWGKQAETIAKYCKKGNPLFVEGRLKLDSWDDKKSGEKRSKMGVVLENFQLLGDGGKPRDQAEHPNESKAKSRPPATPVDGADSDDEVPF